MCELRDANVLIVQPFPSKNISTSSLLLSLGIKSYRMINLNDPCEAVRRTFHQRFEILICDQSYAQGRIKANDVIRQLMRAKALDQRSLVVMDCGAKVEKDMSYYLADVPLHANASQREIAERIRSEFVRKNKALPLLTPQPCDTEQDVEKRHRFFEQYYPQWQSDVTLSRGHYHLRNQRTKNATELYGSLIKQSARKDTTLEICYFLNALALNGQIGDALALHVKLSSGKLKLGQPFFQLGGVLQLANGDILPAYHSLHTSLQRFGMNLEQRIGLALVATAIAKLDHALELFSANLNCAKRLNQDVAQHIMNYLFALVMSWTNNPQAGTLYHKKFRQLLQDISRLRLSEGENLQLTLLKAHADHLVGKQRISTLVNTLVSIRKMRPYVSETCQLHALYVSALVADDDNFYDIYQSITANDAVFVFEPLAALNTILIKQLEQRHFSSVMGHMQLATA